MLMTMKPMILKWNLDQVCPALGVEIGMPALRRSSHGKKSKETGNGKEDPHPEPAAHVNGLVPARGRPWHRDVHGCLEPTTQLTRSQLSLWQYLNCGSGKKKDHLHWCQNTHDSSWEQLFQPLSFDLCRRSTAKTTSRTLSLYDNLDRLLHNFSIHDDHAN